MAGDKDEGQWEIPLRSIVASKRAEQQRQGQNSEVQFEQVKGILDETTDQLNNVKGMMELFPEFNKVMELKTSGILSPRDFVEVGLKLKFDKDLYEPSEKAHKCLTEVEKFLKRHTRFEKDMARYINEALFMYGAHIYVMIPPNALDQAIQGQEEISMESLDSTFFQTHTKFVSDERKIKLGALGISDFSDNVNALREALIRKQQAENRRTEVAMESIGFAPIVRNKKRNLVSLFSNRKDLEKEGEPILFEASKDSCLPLHDPTDPSIHNGYIFQLDEHGHIATNVEDSNYFEKLNKRLTAAMESESTQEYSALKQMGFDENLRDGSKAEEIMALYEREVEKQIVEAIKETGDGQFFKLKEHEPFYRLMFSRAMAQQKTRLLYVPAYMVDYMAFDYDSLGMGVSLLEKTQLYTSLRAVVMFSDLIRQITNNIPQQSLNITLDDKVRDAPKQVRTMLMEYGRITDRSIPLGTFSATSMLDELRRSGIRVNVDGGDRYPNTKLEVEDVQRNIQRVDDELAEQLKRAQYAGFSVPAEAVDQALAGDFAINTLTENQLFAKTCMGEQKIFRELMRNRIRKFTYLSNSLYSMIKDAVGEDEVDEFLDAIDLQLPQADEVRLEQQIEAYSRYADFIDDVMEAHISDTMLRGLINADITGNALEEIRALFAAHFKRQYLRTENILPELQRLHSSEDDDVIADKLNEYHDGILETIGEVVKGLMKADEKLGKVEQDALAETDVDQDGIPNKDDADYGQIEPSQGPLPTWQFGGQQTGFGAQPEPDPFLDEEEEEFPEFPAE
ncbi:hypothetical protein [Vibrio phage vB_VmeM-Yong XC32]|nr:hypothetical protein [Vibrio phage vB_VmeM-Yong XC31]QAX96309.1 hypothetical protein [Vibrio phage vB_VmeM-Yong XC32]QAX96627.1 hypothetical protein [Vibrio phage vB_VmeM-Yong MS31]QAX96945.1 hypothetical protein [Vibrio phage vB_VmeM-Yong MS32]